MEPAETSVFATLNVNDPSVPAVPLTLPSSANTTVDAINSARKKHEVFKLFS